MRRFGVLNPGGAVMASPVGRHSQSLLDILPTRVFFLVQTHRWHRSVDRVNISSFELTATCILFQPEVLASIEKAEDCRDARRLWRQDLMGPANYLSCPIGWIGRRSQFLWGDHGLAMVHHSVSYLLSPEREFWCTAPFPMRLHRKQVCLLKLPRPQKWLSAVHRQKLGPPCLGCGIHKKVDAFRNCVALVAVVAPSSESESQTASASMRFAR